MASQLVRVGTILGVLVIGAVAIGSAAAAGWGMMGGGMGSGMMRGSDAYGRSSRGNEGGSGQAVFASACASCHDIRQGARGGDGPDLHGVVGRRAGSLPGYAYSQVMRRSGVVWTMANLNRFIADPAAFIPGNHMPFSGLRNSEERRELLSYLRSATR